MGNTLKTYLHMTLKKESHRSAADAPSGIGIASLRTEADFRTVALLYGSAFEEAPWSDGWHNFAGFDAKGVFFAYEGGTAIGFVVSYVRPDNPLQGYISVVGTAPSYRRRGIATALIHQALSRFWEQGYQVVVIDVAADNQAACRVYRSVGFSVAKTFTADEHCRTQR